MAVRKIILLGDPALYERSEEVRSGEEGMVGAVVEDLHDTMTAFRERFGSGRAIAAPQIGVRKRIVYMNTGSPVVFVNPVLVEKSGEMIELWDDCMSFPGLFVKVSRHAAARVDYLDAALNKASMALEGGLSELLQHEIDHLDGILATMRAVDSRSFRISTEMWEKID
ncbi:MAG TPA: peptide deformylase [Candidatus Krumholzibacterium sp.]|nr:peptide deformylase [Candidatus Krumholzibacterium sp.]